MAIKRKKKTLSAEDEDDFSLELPDLGSEDFDDCKGVESRTTKGLSKHQAEAGLESLRARVVARLGKKLRRTEDGKLAAPDQHIGMQDPNHAAGQPGPQAARVDQPSKATDGSLLASAKKTRKKKKTSAAALDKNRIAAAGMCEAPLSQQADWLWRSFASVTGASDLERAGLKEEALTALAGGSSLEQRVKAFGGGLLIKMAADTSREPGSPLVIVVAASAVTANELGKHFRGLTKAHRVAKLFAKHFKVSEQQRDLHRCVTVAVGTPNRLAKLAELGSLRLGDLRLLLLDVATDAKQRTILDIPEVRSDLWEQLFAKRLQRHLASGQAKLALIDSGKLL